VAGNWRIRHKLMLGVALVMVVMALLLVGTLKGLFTFKAQMRAFDNMLGPTGELDKAESLRTQIRALLNRPESTGQQYSHLADRLQKARVALDEYKAKLQENVDDGRDREHGHRERRYVSGLQEHFNHLEQCLQDAKTPHVVTPGAADTNDLLAEGHPVRQEIDALNRTASDLVNVLNRELSERVAASRSEQRTTVWILGVTSITAVVLIAGMFAIFYRSVVRPLRTLQRGVGGVARGDFSRRIEIHSGDEIQDLADAFNEMTGRLREMYANLAQQVNERSRQLVRSERLAGVGFLAAGVAHEINNPLASIAFCSEALERRLDDLLRQRPADTEEQKIIAKYLKMIQEEAFRCKEITEKLLAFSRGGERKRERIDLAEVVQGVLDVVQHLQNCKGKQLAFVPQGPILAWANSQEIKQVFLNLVVNALDSMDEGGSLTITHGKRPGMVELVFRDSGCGMSAEVLENLFEPFFTRNRTGKGTGLGLSISHRIITQHGGEIEANSDGPGKGSTFVVRLPIDAPAEATPESEADPDPKQLFAKLSGARKVA
jgi:two-component system NtrC family sensor kinase